MKYIKTYENINNVPKVGDYILILPIIRQLEKEFMDFFKDNIGKIVRIGENNLYFVVKFENIPNNLKPKYNKSIKHEFRNDYQKTKCTWTIYDDEIVAFSPDKEVLESLLRSKKYNL